MTGTKKYCSICKNSIKKNKKNIFDTRFGIDGLYHFYHCSKCDLLILANRPKSNRERELYEKYYNYPNQNVNEKYTFIKLNFFNSILYKIWMLIDGDICFHAKKGNGKLLDVGCNEGIGLAFYEKNGFDVEGLEINTYAAQVARNNGFFVNFGNIETFEREKYFDIVVLSNILEHADSPLKVLSQAYRLLKQSGELWISTPNANSIFRLLFGKYWINWHAPFHLNIFSQKALFNILNKTGFEINGIKHISPSLWISQSFISTVFSKIGHKTLQHRNPLLLGMLMIAIRFFFFPILYFINCTKKGDCIIITASKF